MKTPIYLALLGLLMFASCDKCYVCTEASTDQQEICERGGKITKSVAEAESAGWTCVERLD